MVCAAASLSLQAFALLLLPSDDATYTHTVRSTVRILLDRESKNLLKYHDKNKYLTSEMTTSFQPSNNVEPSIFLLPIFLLHKL